MAAAAAAAAYASLTSSNLLPGESKPKAPTITRVTIDELKAGAHIMVKKVTKDTKVTLYRHHILIGRVKDHSLRIEGSGIEIVTREIEVFDTKKKRESAVHPGRGTALVRSFKVYATKQIVDKDDSAVRWLIKQDNLRRTFQRYVDRGLKILDHPDYNQDSHTVIGRAQACLDRWFDYNIQHNNCEHFVTGIKGLLGGYGWSFQTKSKGKTNFGSFLDTRENEPVQVSEAGNPGACAIPYVSRYAETDSDTDGEEEPEHLEIEVYS